MLTCWFDVAVFCGRAKGGCVHEVSLPFAVNMWQCTLPKTWCLFMSIISFCSLRWNTHAITSWRSFVVSVVAEVFAQCHPGLGYRWMWLSDQDIRMSSHSILCSFMHVSMALCEVARQDDQLSNVAGVAVIPDRSLANWRIPPIEVSFGCFERRAVFLLQSWHTCPQKTDGQGIWTIKLHCSHVVCVSFCMYKAI